MNKDGGVDLVEPASSDKLHRKNWEYACRLRRSAAVARDHLGPKGLTMRPPAFSFFRASRIEAPIAAEQAPLLTAPGDMDMVRVDLHPVINLLSLDADILDNIIAKLPVSDLLTTAQVCRTLRDAVDQPHVLKARLLDHRDPKPANEAQLRRIAPQEINRTSVWQDRLEAFKIGEGGATHMQMSAFFCSSVSLPITTVGSLVACSVPTSHLVLWATVGAPVGMMVGCLGIGISMRFILACLVNKEINKNFLLNERLTQTEAARLETTTCALYARDIVDTSALKRLLIVEIRRTQIALTRINIAINALRTDSSSQELRTKICDLAHLLFRLDDPAKNLDAAGLGAILLAAIKQNDFEVMTWAGQFVDWQAPTCPGDVTALDVLESSLTAANAITPLSLEQVEAHLAAMPSTVNLPTNLGRTLNSRLQLPEDRSAYPAIRRALGGTLAHAITQAAWTTVADYNRNWSNLKEMRVGAEESTLQQRLLNHSERLCRNRDIDGLDDFAPVLRLLRTA